MCGLSVLSVYILVTFVPAFVVHEIRKELKGLFLFLSRLSLFTLNCEIVHRYTTNRRMLFGNIKFVKFMYRLIPYYYAF